MSDVSDASGRAQHEHAPRLHPCEVAASSIRMFVRPKTAILNRQSTSRGLQHKDGTEKRH